MGQKTVTMKVILLFLLHSIICCSKEISQPFHSKVGGVVQWLN